MRGRGLIATATLLLGWSLGCGMAGDGEAALKQQEVFAERTCACANVACLKRVQEAHATWLADHSGDVAAAAVADSKRFQAALDRMGKCVESITGEQVDAITGDGKPTPAAGPGRTKAGKRGGKKGKKARTGQ